MYGSKVGAAARAGRGWMDWVWSGRAVKVESERDQWCSVDPLQWAAMDLGWKLLVIYHLVGNIWANVIESKALELPSGYMLVYKDQATQEEDETIKEKETTFLSRRQDSSQLSGVQDSYNPLDVLHSPQAPSPAGQHQRGGAPHPLGHRPRWDVPDSHGWSEEELQRVDWAGQREPQRRVGLNLDPVLAPKNFTVAGQEVKYVRLSNICQIFSR